MTYLRMANLEQGVGDDRGVAERSIGRGWRGGKSVHRHLRHRLVVLMLRGDVARERQRSNQQCERNSTLPAPGDDFDHGRSITVSRRECKVASG